MPPVWPFTLVFTLWIVILVATSLLILYPTVRTPRRVLHMAGVRELAASVLLFTLGATIEGTFWSGLTSSPWALTAARGVMAGASLAIAAAAWNFARPFIDGRDDEFGADGGPDGE